MISQGENRINEAPRKKENIFERKRELFLLNFRQKTRKQK